MSLVISNHSVYFHNNSTIYWSVINTSTRNDTNDALNNLNDLLAENNEIASDSLPPTAAVVIYL